ncbi:MAG: hypothetical protein J7M24_04365, partial [Candidatus Latescibacteria bacterium]|nr:hypothetical protein [Candidatus Latescibacterota bacterium]
MKRRNFLGGAVAGSAFAASAAGMLSAACSSMKSRPRETLTVRENGRYDILFRGGHVIDPANNIDAVMDVAVAGDAIARVDSRIPETEAKKTVDVSGLYVAPGFIDMHVHVFHTYPLYG